VALGRELLSAGAAPGARHDLATALLAAGQLDEAERIALALIEDGTGGIREQVRLLAILAAQGRFAEAWRRLHELPRSIGGLGPGELAYLRVQLAAGSGEVARLGDAAVEAVRLRPEAAGAPLVLLALAGDPALALKLGAGLDRTGVAGLELEAVAGWRRGQRAEAIATVARLEQRSPWPEDAIAPAYLLAELHADGGEPSEVVAAAERFQRSWPAGVWRGWAWTRSLLLSAEASARLGRTEEARATTDRALALLRRADPGLRLLADLRALRDRLGQGPGPAAPSRPGAPAK
jgi:tetratricopeptide (TPR) repeat protein